MKRILYPILLLVLVSLIGQLVLACQRDPEVPVNIRMTISPVQGDPENGVTVSGTGADPSLKVFPETGRVPESTITPPLVSPTKMPSVAVSLPNITGRVVDLAGEPIAGVSVSTLQVRTTTDSDGRFQLATEQTAQWVTFEHPGFLSHTRAAAAGLPVLVRLTPDDGETISIHFVGDVMFGRRFYDPNEDGDTSDGLLQIGDGVDEHAALVRAVQPLLANADLTVVNLEAPLTNDPYVNPIQPRPARFHSTKDYVFASEPVAALALRQVGVDVIDLGNNHLYDVLEAGIGETLQVLQESGFRPGSGYFGAGLTEQQAWRPALVADNGQTLAFLGCTSITGSQHVIDYVASDVDHTGGAAACTDNAIQAVVTEAKANYDVVIFMIHGGYEYGRSPSANIRRMTEIAREAGATLVINHHPHVVGGFDWNGTSLVAWTLGNFLFDQTVWPTFETYLLAVHLRRGQVIRAYIQPLMIEDYQPKGLTGELAEFVTRGAAGREAGPFITDNGIMEVDIDDRAIRHNVTMSIDGGPEVGTIFHLDRNWWVSDFSGSNDIQLGRDLLWVGSFEDEDVDEQQLEAALWELEGPDKQIGSAYAYAGNAGVQLRRGVHNGNDVVLTPLHRILVEPGSELSVIGMARSIAKATLNLQLSWYADTEGPSTTRTIEPIIFQADNVWQPFRFDVSVPANTVAVGLYFRLQPPSSGVTAVDLDNIRVIDWAASGSRFSPLYDHIRVVGRGEITVSKDLLPDRELDAIPDWLLIPRLQSSQ